MGKWHLQYAKNRQAPQTANEHAAAPLGKEIVLAHLPKNCYAVLIIRRVEPEVIPLLRWRTRANLFLVKQGCSATC